MIDRYIDRYIYIEMIPDARASGRSMSNSGIISGASKSISIPPDARSGLEEGMWFGFWGVVCGVWGVGCRIGVEGPSPSPPTPFPACGRVYTLAFGVTWGQLLNAQYRVQVAG